MHSLEIPVYQEGGGKGLGSPIAQNPLLCGADEVRRGGGRMADAISALVS